MACIESDCNDCRHVWSSNESSGRCPKCGSGDVSTFFDEYAGAGDDIELYEIHSEGGAD